MNLLTEIPIKERTQKLYVLRLDLIHPEYGGNKYFKLKYNIKHAIENNYSSILTFGGAYSNHILATSFACKENGLKSYGVIRGEEVRELNDVLKTAEKNGMELIFVSREDYRLKEKAKEINQFITNNNPLVLPEGGTNDLAVKGCREIINQIDIGFDTICCASGTGGTAAGILSSIKPEQKLLSIPVLKGDFMRNEILNYTQVNAYFNQNQLIVNNNYHFGGYAKTTSDLIQFSEQVNTEHHLKLDLQYNAKLFYAVFDLLKQNFFKPHETIVIVKSDFSSKAN